MEPKRMHNGMIRPARKEEICGGEIRINLDDDRLSNLPDELIHKILSFISIKQAIRTSVLSCRWKFTWTSMPYLNFENFYPSDSFSKLVSKVLSRHNYQVQVSSVKLVIWKPVSKESVKEILNYAFSHNLQQLNESSSTSLFITTPTFGELDLPALTPTLDLPALTTLHLDHVILSDDNSDKCIGFISKFPNLKNLYLKGIRVMGMNVLNICHPRLTNLTLEHTYWRVEEFKVVAPQLKHLTITYCYGKHLISAPGLNSLVMTSDYPLHLSTDGFPSLEKVDLCIFNPLMEFVDKIVSLLQQFHSVKFLTLNVDILELLSSSMEHF